MAHGFEVDDGHNDACYRGVVATVAGFLEPTAGGADSSVVICYVYAADPAGLSKVEETSRGTVELRLGNVGCSTLESRPEAPAVERLRAALEEFERTIRP